MRRRDLLKALCGAAAAVPVAARAQKPRLRRVGFLGANTAAAAGHLAAAFADRLKELGWVEGATIAVDYRWAAGQTARFRELAAEMVAAGAEVIVTSGDAAGLATREVTRTVPIVMASSANPVAAGLAQSLAHPGGNVTGLTSTHDAVAGKRLELLKELLPNLRRAAVLSNPDANPRDLAALKAAASELVVTLDVFAFRRVADLDGIVLFPERSAIDAMVVLSEPLVFSNRVAINDFALRERLPTMHSLREYARDGGTMAYGPDFNVQFRRAADFVDRILKGAKPGDLPIEAPTRYELVINLKVAKALGLDVPGSLLARADEVIE